MLGTVPDPQGRNPRSASQDTHGLGEEQSCSIRTPRPGIRWDPGDDTGPEDMRKAH